MTVFKCKMCGGTLEITEGSSVCTCEFCDTVQTLPTIQDEGLQNLFNRANVLRMKSEFDKAAEIYEKILQKSSEESEAYWGLILCKYGIEYVEDPNTYKRIPTCHRASYDSVIADDDYKMALQYADVSQKAIYEEEARVIDEVQKGIIALAQKADPYDVFICYKETDENGQRTQDSVIANDIYYQLTQEGFKVFYAAITLEDKLGSEYEPYIFSALNTAKVLLSIGTKPEYFNAVWVKNEWSRFLKIMKNDRSKMLIPCYKDMDAYELPEEFAHLQAQNMGKIGFINDLVRGIKKVIVKEEVNKPSIGTTVVQTTYSSNVQALLDRGHMALEDSEWDKADGFYEEVLNQDAKCADAYLGKLMVELKASSVDNLENCDEPFDDSLNYKKAMRFGTDELKKTLEGCLRTIRTRIDEQMRREAEEKEAEYQKALVCFGLVHNPEQESMISEENERHEAVSTRLQHELEDAKEKSLEQENLLLSEKSNIENEYEKYLESLNDSLKDTQMRHNEILQRKEQELSSLGLFAGKRKKELSQEISNNKSLFDKEEREIESDIEHRKIEYQTKMSVISKKLVEVHVEEKRIQSDIESENKLYSSNIDGITSKDYKSGVQIVTALGDYKDCRKLRSKYSLLLSTIGDIVPFGKYDWKVLSVSNKKALIIAEKSVVKRPYHNTRTDVTWETCSLRKWLNDDFYSDAFSPEEQSRIMITTVSPGSNPNYSTNAGNATEDRIFLLSIDEVNQYFSSDESMKCEYDGKACWWWLRSPGSDQDGAADVLSGGSVYYCGFSVVLSDGAVRPVLWINLES